jgi:GntR family transcriptional regulator/MocR family aminotransferase
MQISLERDAGREAAPIYRQIAAQFRAEIAARRLAAGDKLPPIRELARRLGVNRDTVALAYEELSRSGVVESTVGRGTFVAGAASTPQMAPFEPRVSPLVDRLLELERARPRFGSVSGAAPLHSLIPDPRLYPAEAFRKLLNRVLQQEGAELLLYGGPQGHPRMREVLAGHLGEQGVVVDPEELVLCHGASQGIALAVRLFAGAGDAVAVEEPTYNNVLAALAGLGLEPAPVPMREAGLDLVALERTLARPEVKLLYTIPTFHNPTGGTTSLQHRRALLEIAEGCGKPVVEDAYEMDLRIDGKPVPPLAALDRSGLVVQLSSFSKSLFPGVRVGAVAARGRLVDALLALKQATDLSDAMPLQLALAEFVASGAYARHLAKLRRELRRRRDALLEALGEHMPEGAHWTRPEGGLQMWVELPEGVDTNELLPDAVAAGVLFAPGAQFHHDGRPSRGLRLSFATADEEQLRRGVAALGRVIGRRSAEAPRRAVGVPV